MTTITPTSCKHCTVPTTADQDISGPGDHRVTVFCSFCSNYTPPETVAQQLDVAVNRIDLLRHDLNEVLNSLPPDAPLFGCADLTTGICHLKRAAVAIDRAADQLEADAKAVTR